ncbi:MAG TPA: PQQ-dependent sugar dehydrogenase [Alphaproteobacteria bacterium]|jgi:quinoprotein glucose dehydrogenase|nr:PQQ-dependent sugar dehydrogenase [Alphaproteobacteria bacterium]
MKMLKKIFYYTIILSLFSFSAYSINLKFTKIVNLDYPWSLTFINDNELLISEKNGKIKLINLSTKKIKEIEHNLIYSSYGQGGLLDIIYKDDTIWISYSEDRDSSKTSTSIAKATYNTKKINFKNIFQANPPIKSGYHFGSRLAIQGNYLYASVGERGKGMIAQDGSQHPGSIIRIHTDGSIPKDNPKFNGMNNWLPEIYQIGVRNPQGLTLSSFDNKIYISNHGARGGDWFGEVIKGENYGWQILGWGGTNYSGTNIGPKWKAGFTKAIYYWVPSIATSAITIYNGEEFKEWNGHALIASLKDQSLRKLIFLDVPNIKEDVIFKDKIGRIRDIQVHPNNGKIFFLSENKLWKMEKAK